MPGTRPMIASRPKRMRVPGIGNASSSRISSLRSVSSRKIQAPRFQRAIFAALSGGGFATPLRGAASSPGGGLADWLRSGAEQRLRSHGKRGLRRAHLVRAAALSLLCGRSGQTFDHCFDASIERVDGGYSSVAERLTVAQDVEGSIPSSRPKKVPRIGLRILMAELSHSGEKPL